MASLEPSTPALPRWCLTSIPGLALIGSGGIVNEVQQNLITGESLVTPTTVLTIPAGTVNVAGGYPLH